MWLFWDITEIQLKKFPPTLNVIIWHNIFTADVDNANSTSDLN